MTATPLALDPVTVADLASSRAAMFGIVVTDITAPMNDAYRLTRAWADTFCQAGFSGLASRSRIPPNPPNGCPDLFGSAGEHRSGQTASGIAESPKSSPRTWGSAWTRSPSTWTWISTPT